MKHRNPSFGRRPFATIFAACWIVWTGLAAGAQPQPAWRIRPLVLDANEGCAIGDIDGNGSPDIVAGRNWYPAPEFTPRPLRTIEDWNGYVQSNGDFLFDVNGDGRLDVIAGSFIPGEVHWYQNPGDEALRLGHLWPRHLLADTGRSENEAQLLSDLDQDGTPEWLVNSWNPKNPLLAWRFVASSEDLPGGAKYRMEAATLAATGNSHGLGAGDLNGAGKFDVLTGAGWYQQPESNPWDQPWSFHPDWQIQASIPMLVADVDRDGRSDVLVGQGHDYGLSWWRQLLPQTDGTLAFDKILIDKSYSQPHALALADLDGDGRDELITGKRYFAHNGGDPGGREPPLIVAYAFDPEEAAFHKTVIEQGHVGIGLQIATGDLDGNRSIDLAVAGKSGSYVLFNPRGSDIAPADRSQVPRISRELVGWTLHIHPLLLDQQAMATNRALELLQVQLEEIDRTLPPAAVADLKKVPLWLSPEYPQIAPQAEYHPGRQWLREQGRDERMVRGVEFTNVRIFEEETRRMPNFALHELAHAYHHRVLSDGFENRAILQAYAAAVAGGKYDRVERQDAQGNLTHDRHYGLTNPPEYFAECSEAFFARNDFFPYDRQQLQQVDPAVCELLAEAWGVTPSQR